MWITIANAGGRTDEIRGGVAEADLYSGHLYVKDESGTVVGERDDVVSVSKFTATETEPQKDDKSFD